MRKALKVMSIINLAVGGWLMLGTMFLIADNEMDGYTTAGFLWAAMVITMSIMLLNFLKKTGDK